MKVVYLLLIFTCFYSSYGQIVNKNRVSKRLTTSKDTIQLENVAISPVNFEIKNQKGQLISSNKYNVNYAKGQLFFNTQQPQQITVSYFNYPTFLTQTYSPFDKKLIISKATPQAQTYSLKKEYSKKDFFGGINTYGNITRGITVGNNQGSVLNSGLDLQITGNLSENLKIRASIKDSNVPIQENGVSQNINEFDRVFIELFTDTWNLKAGDVDLTNHDSYFLNFTKKINGAKLDVVLDNGDQKTTITASGALAKGRFNTQNITTQEGNQGPYRLLGVNGEQNIVIISNSETIYVNGVTLKRGEQYDYTIDYNLSEITFNPTFPINSSQRIIVDYQYSDQNYNRFVTHDGVKYETEKFSIGTYFYNENDVKNQPIQQNLSDVQKQTLQQAGNNPANMVAPSAQTSNYDENRIQYLKNEDGNFIQSSNENETLYNVIFSFVGNNQGDYILSETVATGSIYEYIAPINGISQGNYSPITQLFAPTKTQMAVVNTSYKINKKSFINAELAYSDNDQNLFSTIDDKQNKGIATTLAWQQQISDKDWKSYNLLDVDFVQKNFNNIEGLYNAEFNRDWNIDVNLTPNFLGNQSYLRNAFTLQKDEQHQFVLNNEYLSFGADFTGLKNALNTFNSVKKLSLKTENSFVNSKNILEKGTFIRHHSSLKYRLKKIWVTGLLDYENNHQKNKKTQLLDSIQSQKYSAIGADFGVGDSTKVYTKFSYSLVKIDSVKTNRLERVQNTHNYSIESQIIKNKQASLHTFINYRKVNHLFFEDVDIMNARTLYNQQLFKDIIRLSTVYETSSGNTLQQNFTYIETEPGQGYYYYLGDLNNNGKKDFDEFEVAQFTDQANYLRVILPNTNRVATQKAKLSQSIFINFMQYQNHTSKWLQLLSHFSNQSSILINKDQLKQGKAFNINPFNTNNKNVVALQQNVFTSFYFNRGLQNYSTTYTYQNNQNTQNTSSDIETATQESHELNFQHNTQSSWVLGTVLRTKNIENTSQSYSSRNFNLASYTLNPSVDFLKDEFSTLKATYTYRNEKNKIGEEALISHDFGLNYNYNNLGKGSVLASINIIENNYKGAINTPASYRILEGLEPNRNYTWSLIIQRKLTQLLDLSINYNGRKNTSTNTIHVGSVQLRANF